MVIPESKALIAPWSEKVRYGVKKNGYHGGITPQEMIVKLEEKGLITREPGVPRSVRVTVPRSEIPDLEDDGEEERGHRREGPQRAVSEGDQAGGEEPAAVCRPGRMKDTR